MFKSIQKVKGLGVFADYTAPAGILEFGTKNLIYGWNYSGKTTLSRLIGLLDTKKPNPELPAFSFAIATDSGTVTELNYQATSHIVRVVNSDFVADNLNFSGSAFKPILLLGSESEAAQIEIDRSDAMLKRARAGAQFQEGESAEAAKALSAAKTATAAAIKKTVGLVAAFGATQLDAELKTVQLGMADHVLSVESLQADLKLAYTSEKDSLPPVPPVAIKAQLDALANEAMELLSRKPEMANTIAHLVENPPIESWIESGMHLHKGKETCEFCGGSLAADRLQALSEHFSKELADYKISIQTVIDKISGARLIFLALKEQEFNAQFRDHFNAANGQTKMAIDAYNEALDEILGDLEAKLKAPFTVVERKPINEKLGIDVDSAVKALNAVIQDNNAVAGDLPQRKSAAIRRLKLHFAQEFENAQDMVGQAAREKRRASRKERYERCADTLQAEIDRLKAVISHAQFGREEINKRIESLLGGESVQIAVVDVGGEERFQLVRRDGTPARHLSEGEKTAIAFSYFLTKLREIKNFEEAIVYIDDPISSLDSNHIFQVAAILRETFFRQDLPSGPWRTVCKQVFFSTHNFEFFSLLREIGHPQKTTRRYRVKRIDPKASTFENMPESMAKHPSEYHFLFHVIDDFHKAPDKTDYKVLMLLPNAVRRFVELYVYSKIPSETPLDARAEKLMGPEKAKRILKVLHHFSHGGTMERMAQNSDLMSVVAGAIDDLLSYLQATDPDHLAALRAPLQ